MGYQRISLLEIADLLRLRVDVRDRKFRFKKYRNCFVASEAVTIIVEQHFANTREEAVILGRRLEKELGLWHHVCNDHAFKDENLFFRFSADEDSSDNDSFFKNMNSSVVENDTIRIGDEFLLSIADKLEVGLDIGKRTCLLRTYGNRFAASEAVDFMIKHELTNTREEAVEIGRRLEDELGFWKSIRPGQRFCDENIIFRLTSDCEQDEISSADDSASLSPVRQAKRAIGTLANGLLPVSPQRGRMGMRRLLMKRDEGQRGGFRKGSGSAEIVVSSAEFDRLPAEEKAKMLLLEFGIAESYSGGFDEAYYEE